MKNNGHKDFISFLKRFWTKLSNLLFAKFYKNSYRLNNNLLCCSNLCYFLIKTHEKFTLNAKLAVECKFTSGETFCSQFLADNSKQKTFSVLKIFPKVGYISYMYHCLGFLFLVRCQSNLISNRAAYPNR